MLATLIVTAGCVPLVEKTPVPPARHAAIDVLFSDTDETVLVIPMWQDYPLVRPEASVREEPTLFLGTPVFTRAGGLQSVHRSMPAKTSAGVLIGPTTAIGKGTFFHGFVIISASGNALFVGKSRYNLNETRRISVTGEEKDALIEAFTRSGEQVFPEGSIFATFVGRAHVKFDFSDSDRARIVEFLSSAGRQPDAD